MSLPDVEWTTNYPGSQDPDDNSNQQDLVNESTPGAGDGHNTRVSQILTLRNKLQAAAKLIGDNNRLPSTSIMKRVWDLENSPPASPPSGPASGQLSGTYPGPSVAGITETDGPTALTFGAIADGKYLKRSGSTVVGADDTVGATNLDEAYDGTGGSGAGKAIAVDSGAVELNADSNQALKLESANGLGGENRGLQEIDNNQSGDNQNALRIAHDYDGHQGSIVEITGVNGQETADGETLYGVKTSVPKKIPATENWYTVGSAVAGNMKRKEGAGSWTDVTHGLTGTNLKFWDIGGLDGDNIWVVGEESDRPFLAKFNGTVWTEDTNFKAVLASEPTGNKATYVHVVSTSEIYVVTYNDAQNRMYLLHGDGAGTWTNKSPTGTYWTISSWAWPSGAGKVGTTFAISDRDAIHYTNDISANPPTWATDTSIWSSPPDHNCALLADAPRSRFIAGWRAPAGLDIRYGMPGGTWNQFFTPASADGGSWMSGKSLWVGPTGKVYLSVGDPVSGKRGFWYDLETASPQFIAGSAFTPPTIENPGVTTGLADDNIRFTIGIGRALWDGGSVTSDLTDYGLADGIWAYSAGVGTATFKAFSAEFTGQDIDNEAVAFEALGGATHALKAQSGKIELDDGTVILGKQTSTPATPTNKGVFYTKEVSGETEAFYLGTDGNEVQLTEGGELKGGIPDPFVLSKTQTADDQPSMDVNHTAATYEGKSIDLAVSTSSIDESPRDEVVGYGAVATREVTDAVDTIIVAQWTDDNIYRKIADGAWGNIKPAGLVDPHQVHGISNEHFWVVGGTSSSGYIAHTTDGGNNWTINPNSHPWHGSAKIIIGVFAVSTTEVYTVSYGGGTYDIDMWTGSAWVDKGDVSSAGAEDAQSVVKSGNTLLWARQSGITYTDDIDSGTPTWNNTVTPFGLTRARFSTVDPTTGDFIVGISEWSAPRNIIMWRGSPSGGWSQIYNLDPSSGDGIWPDMIAATGDHWAGVSPSGKIYAVFRNYTTSVNYLLVDAEGTQQLVVAPEQFCYLEALADDNIIVSKEVSGGIYVYRWDGATFNALSGAGRGSSLFAYSASVYAKSDIMAHDINFVGDAPTGAKSVAVKVRNKATHALHAASGAITLAAQNDPVEETGYASIYPKDVGGVTEWFARDDDGNVIQLTSGGAVAGAGGGSSTLDEAYDGGTPDSGSGRTVTVDQNAVVLNADGNAALQATSANGLGTDDALVKLTHTQEADNKPTQKIAHDFNSNQGSAVEFAGVVSGDGIPDGETARLIFGELEKKVPASISKYVGHAGGARSKHGTNPWDDETVPGGVGGLECINGSATDNVWMSGGIGNATGCIIVDDGTGFARVGSGGAHPTFGTHPYDGQPCENGIEWVWPVSKTEIWTVSYTWPSGNRYHRWDPTNGWVEKHIAPNGGWFQLVAIGTYAACGQPGGDIYYSADSGDSWGTDSTFSGDPAMVRPHSATGKMVVLTRIAGGIARIWEGYPGGTWDLINSFSTGWGSVDLYGLYVTGGKYFAVVGSGSSRKFIHSWDTTPVGIDLVASSGDGGVSGASSNYVIFEKDNSEIYIWDGASLTSEAHGSSLSTKGVWAYSNPTGTGTFSLIDVGFSGSAGDNDAVALKVGGGATHAVKATTGKIELDNGVVILGEQSETPATPTNKGVFYTKDVGGETEAFYLGTDGNEVQITTGGNIKNPLILTADNLELNEQGSAPATPTDKGIFYTKEVSGQTEAFYLDTAGNEVQLTSGGVVKAANTLDQAYDGAAGSGAGRTITADSEAVQLNADGNAALKATSANGVGTDDALVELTHAQEADYKPSIKVTHDYNGNQGSAIKLSSANAGDGTPSGEQVECIDATVIKKVPSEKVYYAAASGGTLKKKIDDGAWNTVFLPGTPSDLYTVHGLSVTNVWVAGTGYIAVDSGSGFVEVNGHPTYGTHPMLGASRIIHSVLVVSASEVWTNTQDDSSGVYSRLHKWDPTNGWVEKFSINRSGGNSIYRNIVKVGTYLVAPASDKLFYSLNDGEDWATESTPWAGGGYIGVSVNTSNTKFQVIKKVSGDLVLYEGVPGDPGTWAPINTYDSGGTDDYSETAYGSNIYTDENGKAFVLANSNGTHGMIYNWDTTPTFVAGSYCKGISGTSDLNVIFANNSFPSTSGVGIWDGATVTNFNIGVTSVRSTWAYEAPSEGSLFNVYRGAFSGSAGSNKAVIFKGGTGATHALHADSGVVTLPNMAEDPATESGKVSYYAKDVSGAAEAHIKDDQDNVIQLTSGGAVKLPTALSGETVTLDEQASKPSTPTDAGIFYTKEVGGETEAFYLGTDGNEVQLTEGGELKGAMPDPFVINKIQTADNQYSIEVNHDYKDNQGDAIKVTSTNTSDGTPDSESVGGISVSVQKKIATTEIWYGVQRDGVATLFKRPVSGVWEAVSHGLTLSETRDVKGLSDGSKVWMGAEGPGAWEATLAYTTDNINWFIDSAFKTVADTLAGNTEFLRLVAVSVDEVYVFVRQTATSTLNTIRWNGTAWEIIDSLAGWGGVSSDPQQCAALVKGAKTELAYCTKDGIRYTTDALAATPTFATDTSYVSTRLIAGIAADVSGGGRFIQARFHDGSGETRFYALDTFDGGTWSQIAVFSAALTGSGESREWDHMGCAPTGEIYFTMKGTPNGRVFIYDIETGTPSYVVLDYDPRGVYSLNSTSVRFYGSTNPVRDVGVWNGSVLSWEDAPNSLDAYFGFEDPTGTATFRGVKVAFTGQSIDNQAAAFEVGGGATHAVKAASGDVELDNGVVILGEQSSTPATPTDKGVFYTKEVGGETEAFYLDTAGNEVQLTSGGSVNAGGGGGATPHEEKWVAPGTDTPGSIIQFKHDGTPALNATPRGAGSADTESGYDLEVFCNGIKMYYNDPPIDYDSYFYDVANNEIDVMASGSDDRYQVKYGE